MTTENSYLQVWLEQLIADGDSNGAALCESLIRERERSESWKSAVIASGTSYDAMRKILTSYERQIAYYESLFVKITDAPKTFKNIMMAVIFANKMITAKSKEDAMEFKGRFDAEVAAIHGDEVQSSILKQFEFQFESSQLEIPLDA